MVTGTRPALVARRTACMELAFDPSAPRYLRTSSLQMLALLCDNPGTVIGYLEQAMGLCDEMEQARGWDYGNSMNADAENGGLRRKELDERNEKDRAKIQAYRKKTVSTVYRQISSKVMLIDLIERLA